MDHSTGAVNLNGSLQGRDGTLIVRGGTLRSADVQLGYGNKFPAVVKSFNEQGASWDIYGYANIGQFGAASVEITSDLSLNPPFAPLAAEVMTQGDVELTTPVAPFNSSVTISGTKAKWHMKSNFTIQRLKNLEADLTIANSGELVVDGRANIGETGTGNAHNLVRGQDGDPRENVHWRQRQKRRCCHD